MRFLLYSRLIQWLMPAQDRDSWKLGVAVTEKNSLWFHAASSGELEILIPVIEAAVANGRKSCVSIFSPSAESWLMRLPPELLYRGYSPNEGEWLAAFQHYGVSEVITAKYEAWPGMWRAASVGKIRINVICAQMRSSLLWARRALGFMGLNLPRLRFFVLEESAMPELQKYFPESECKLSSDPRWLRVIQRAERAEAHAGLQKWKNKFSQRPLPYWVIGSAWPEDIEFLADAIKNYVGTVWIAPHSLKPAPDPRVFCPASNCVLVDDMGMLVELYSIADRVWVGGGFGKGIHSTLEPSVYLIPVACGPKYVQDFFEARELQAEGVLTVCSTKESLKNWLDAPSRTPTFNYKIKVESIQQMMRSVVT